jgi:TonB family protein
VKSLAFLTVLGISLALPLPASEQAGKVTAVLKDGQARIVWESGEAGPDPGRLGVVMDGDRNLALFKVLETRKRKSTVRVVSSIWPNVVMRGMKARLLDDAPPPPPPDSASFFIWSGHFGQSLLLDGTPAGRTPTQLLLTPGSHQILLELTSGGRAGALVEARAGEMEFLLLSGKIVAAKDEMGPAYLLNRTAGSPVETEREPRHLLWLEDRQGTRIYLPCKPLKAPVIKAKVNPIYPESARRSQVQGDVWVYALLGADGRPMQVQVIAGAAPELARSAVDAVSRWVYEPATLDGEPVPVLLPVAVLFFLSPRPR